MLLDFTAVKVVPAPPQKSIFFRQKSVYDIKKYAKYIAEYPSVQFVYLHLSRYLNLCLGFLIINECKMFRFFSVIFFTLFCNLYQFSQENYFQFTSNDGLSNSSINCITQTCDDLMWFGTWDGLNCYNGTFFKQFKQTPNNLNSISNNVVRQVIEQDSLYLWITTDIGINRLNRHDGTFETFLFGYRNKNVVKERSFTMAMDSQKQIFSAVYGSGLYYWIEHEGFNKLVLPNINLEDIVQIFFDRNDYLYLVNEVGEVYRIKFHKTHNLLSCESIVPINQLSHNGSLHYEVNSNTIFFHNKTRNLYAYHIDSNRLDIALENTQLVSQTLNAVSYTHNNFYFATTNGLFVLDPQKKTHHHTHPSTSILSIFSGSQGVLWLGTDGQGVFRITPISPRFPSYNYRNLPQLGKHAIRSFFETSSQDLWLGTKGGGVFRIEKKTSNHKPQVSHFSLQDGLLSNFVYALTSIDNKHIWIGTDGLGLNYYDTSTQRLQKLVIPQHIKGVNGLRYIYSLYQQNDSILWVGTSGNGIYRLHITNTTPIKLLSFTNFRSQDTGNSLSNNIVYSILPENDSILWLATRGGGLNRLRLSDYHFEIYRNELHNPTHSLSGDDLLCLTKDKQDNLWVGTSMGLNKMVKHADGNISFIHYTEEQGMPNNTIHGIVCDQYNKVWVSSNKGLSSISLTNNEIINYTQSDGLQSNEFSDGAYYKSPFTQHIYFGGINGFNAFVPQNIQRITFMPKITLNNLSIDNKVCTLSDHTDHTGRLQLHWTQKSFVFNFAILDYIHPTKCELAYRLVPYNEHWIEQQNSHTISFSNIPSGDYTLEIRYSNSDKIWNTNIYRLPITINTPWWRSQCAFLFYALLLLAGTVFLYKFFKMKYDLAHNKELEYIEKNKVEEIHQAKLRFFTNIAHEFSNHLSLIYGPAQLLLSQMSADDKSRRQIQTIKTNSERMQSMIQQLMEFRKVETDHVELRPECIDIEELTKYIMDNFQELSTEKNIKLTLHIPTSLHNINSDRSSLEKIVFNLLSNAFKYTPEHNKIDITITQTQELLSIQITNTGIGIEQHHQSIIFDRFKILDQIEKQAMKGYETRTGIGLAVCKNLTDALQGTLQLDSDGQTYTSFTVKLSSLQKLPNQQSNQTTTQSLPATSMIDDSTRIDTEKYTLLIVDDEPQIRALIKDTLSYSYYILEANNGQEGLEQIEKNNIDIIITDLRMPIMDGSEFVKQIKANKSMTHIPIIMLSSLRSVEHQIEGLGTGANSYLPKPFHPQHLKAVISRLIDNQKNLIAYAKSPQSQISVYKGKKMDKKDIEFLETLSLYVIEDLSNEELNLDILASKMLLSKVQFYRKIKNLCDLTPTEFIRNIRIKEVERLLNTSTLSVQEIMFKCGFNNKAYFYRIFAQKYQCTPKEYRQKQKELS